jgi:hypothetical protein
MKLWSLRISFLESKGTCTLHVDNFISTLVSFIREVTLAVGALEEMPSGK